MTRVWWIRAGLLFLVGWLVLHQVRYLVAPDAIVRTFAPAHAYLQWLIPSVGALTLVGFGHWCSRLRAPDRDTVPELPSARAIWAVSAVAVLVAFGLQECTESLLFRGHLPSAYELAGGNGWLLAPLAAAIGGVIALLLKGAARALRWAQERSAATAGAIGVPARRLPTVVLVPRASVLARQLAGRAPPARA
jgi:hypothetical protein